MDLEKLQKEVEFSESMSVAEWKEDTKDWSDIDKALVRMIRAKSFEFRKSKAYSLLIDIEDQQNGLFLYMICSLSDEALDRVLASFS